MSSISEEGGCGEDSVPGSEEEETQDATGGIVGGSGRRGRGEEHVVETLVTVTVKDINDNSPVFPNTTMFGYVNENGPSGEY